MKRLKKEISLLLVLALVVSSLAMGFGQLKASAVNADAPGAGSFQLIISIPQNGENDNFGTDSNFKLQFLNATGGIVSQTPDNAISGAGILLNNNGTYTYDTTNNGVASLGQMAVSKTITQARLVNTYVYEFNEDWNFSNWVLNYWNGSSWVTIVNSQWSGYGLGATGTAPVSYFSNNCKALTFNANGGTGGGSYDAIPGQTISAPTITLPGYTFNGWSPSVPARMPNAAAAYTAQWSANRYNITFDANGGTGGTNQSLAYGSLLSPPTVTRTGYTFRAWSPSVPATVPGVDKTYTAIWLANGESNTNTYSITFDPNGGDGTMPAQTLAFGQTEALSNNTLTKTGYTFLGWATSQAIADSATTEYLNIENYTITNDITLYAVWKANVYLITFDATGGGGGSVTAMTFGEPLSAPDAKRINYTLSDWSPAVPATVPAANTTYTALWTPNQYTVYFSAFGSPVSPETITVTYGSTYGTLPTSTRTGNTFGGWYTNDQGTGTQILSTTAVTLTATQILFAKWINNTYTVVYDGNGSTGGSTASATHTYQSYKALTINGYTKTGYAFAGWATSPDGAVVYSDGQSVGSLTKENGAIVTLYAKWTNVNISTITFDANGGSGGKSSVMIAGAALTAPAVARTGYTLAGWSPAVPATVPAANTTYTAQWTAKTYTVTFNPQSGTVSPATSTVTYNSTFGAGTGGFPIPARTNYTFDGWYTGTGGAGTNILSTTTVAITSSLTLYAKWTGNQYTIAFDANGGMGTASGLMTYGAVLTAPAVTKTGCSLTGWSPALPATVPAADTTYTAQWGTSVNITFDANGGSGGTGTVMGSGGALTAPTVTKTGYTFAGWSPAVPSTVPAVDTTYTAQWIAKTFTVTFNPQSGMVSPTASTVTYDSTYGAGTGGFPTPIRTGFTFGGWFTGTKGGGTQIFSTTIAARTSSQTLYAKWTVIITFDANGGTGGTSSSLAYGAALTAPAVTKAGYALIGWSPALPATVPATDTTYTAQWGISVTITFDANGGNGGKSTVMGYGAALTAPTVTKTGYTSGWYPAVPATVPLVDTTYTAQWTANTYTIIYDGNGGTGSTVSSSHTYDISSNLTANGFTKSDGIFLGWSWDSGATSAGYSDRQSVTSLSATQNGTVTLFAVWASNMLTITFNPNGGAGGSSSKQLYGSVLAAPTVAKTGYTFIGWSPSVPGTVPKTNTTYTAQWRDNNQALSTGDIIAFGSYPQTQVTNAALIAALNSCTPDTDNNVNYEGAKYKKVCFTQYTPYITTYSSDASYSWQDDNGYYINTVYWFKYEPIRWRVLSNLSGELFVLADLMLDSKAYNQALTAVTWEACTLRSWLNADFYNTAFSPAEKLRISSSEVINDDNPSYSTEGGNNTTDKLFLLSLSEAMNTAYGFRSDQNDDSARVTEATDFSKCSGLRLYTGTYAHNSAWWLRSPGYKTTSGGISGFGGYIGVNSGFDDVYSNYIGVRPAAKINLSASELSIITFDANGGTGGLSTVYFTGDPLAVPTVTRTGFTCTGWSPAVPATVPAADTAYTAQWTESRYNVTFDPQGGSVSPTSSTVTYNSTYGVGTGGFPTPTRTGYTFGGWYTSTGGAGTNILSTTTVTITAAQTLYAKWTAITYTVAYNGNGSTGGSTASSMHTYGTAKTLTANGFTKTGYTFAGWATSADGNVVYSNSQSILNLSSTSGDTVALYAKWTANRYSIAFNPQSGTVSPASSTVTYNNTYGAGTGGLPMPARTGYEFDGWYTSTNGGGTRIVDTTAVAITAAQILYANWTANSYTMTFDANGGTGGTSASMTYGATLTAPSVTRASYVFIGWSQAVPTTVGAENANFTALWNLLGDLNSSDSITPIDALMTLQAASEKITLTDIQRLAADIDSSGTISPIDALKILQFTSGKISSF